MTDSWHPPGPGALDDTAWPEQLVARAVQPTANDDRLHGYSVLADLGRNYRFSDVCYLGIVGDVPDEQGSALFHHALCANVTVSAGEAPAHIAILSRLSGGSIAAALAAGMIAVADEAAHIVESHASLLAWLASPTATTPAEYSTEDAAWTQALIEAVGTTRLVRADMTRAAAIVALLYEAGLHTPDHIQAALVISRCCGLPAEPLLTGPQHLGLYPVKVPEYRYVEE